MATNSVIFLVSLILLPLVSAVVKEYCESEAFRARCRQDEAILIESALYGRMRLGRCVMADLGYLGCFTDVLHLVDKRCSGRRECDIRIPDAELDATKACFKELKTYLEVSYSCVPVALAELERCHGNEPMTLTDTGGYLGSVIAEESGCGSSRSPWLISALEGQQVNLTLYDFSTDHNADVQRYPAGSECVQYGVIEEPETGVRMAVCRGNKRVRHLYQSRANHLLVHITQDRDGKTSGYFLIKFEIIGCPKSYEASQDKVTSQEMEQLKDLFPGCRETSTKTPRTVLEASSKGPCTEANCTLSPNKIPKNRHSSAAKNQDIVFLGQGLSAIIIASITVVVSLIIVLLGALIIKCSRARRLRNRLPVAVDQDVGQCTYSERPDATYSTGPLYECKAFSPISPCDRCMSQINVNTYTTHYWDYIKDGTIGSSQLGDTTACVESETSGILLKNLHMSPGKMKDDVYSTDDMDERENATNTYRQCQYGCRVYVGDTASQQRNGSGLYGAADDVVNRPTT